MPLILRAGAGALLVAALALWPYAFYQLLRWLICPTAGFLSFRFRKARRPGRSWTWGVIAVLFNPLIPVSLDRCGFRAKWARHSEACGPPIPIEVGHGDSEDDVGQGFRGRGPVIPTCGPPLGHERRRRWIT